MIFYHKKSPINSKKARFDATLDNKCVLYCGPHWIGVARGEGGG